MRLTHLRGASFYHLLAQRTKQSIKASHTASQYEWVAIERSSLLSAGVLQLNWGHCFFCELSDERTIGNVKRKKKRMGWVDPTATTISFSPNSTEVAGHYDCCESFVAPCLPAFVWLLQAAGLMCERELDLNLSAPICFSPSPCIAPFFTVSRRTLPAAGVTLPPRCHYRSFLVGLSPFCSLPSWKYSACRFPVTFSLLPLCHRIASVPALPRQDSQGFC